jgi:hypothetical protein
LCMIDVLLPTEVDGCSHVPIAFWWAFPWRVSLTPIFLLGQVVTGHFAHFNHTLLSSWIHANSNVFLTILLQNHNCIVAYEHLRAYPSI